MARLNKYFTREEFECQCGCGFDTVDAELLQVLTRLREYYGKGVVVNSAARCESHNAAVGGKPSSQHLVGKAADIVVIGVPPADVYKLLDSWYSDSYGIGKYSTFTHVDVRSGKARW